MRGKEKRGRGHPALIAEEIVREYPETAACEAALHAFLTDAGLWRDRIVLVGGLAPRYLIPEVPEDIEPHRGTTDVDLVLALAFSNGGEPLRTLQDHLKGMGFAPKPDSPGDPAFRWTRDFNGIEVKLEFMCSASDGDPLTVRAEPLPGTGGQLGALRLQGAELAGMDHVVREVVTPEGGFDLRVVNVLPFLVLKAFALVGRRKVKDAYDVVWVLTAHEGDVEEAAAAALASPAASAPVVAQALTILREYFGEVDAEGAIAYAENFSGTHDPVKRRQLQRYASGAVRAFLRAWDAGRR